MKSMKVAVSLLILFLISPAMANGWESPEKKSGGVKAILKIDPEKSMVDLYLNDAVSNRPITGALVKAAIKTPDGGEIEKELIGMRMGEAFSYMNTLEMSKKGKYSFEIKVDSGGTKVPFSFFYDAK
ncbi:MAG: hypothetical protein HZB22_06450 [Deltaproteobacteria bacterium]|nr:hypothetical protein [Deltaproteobacteria bacterium]